MQPCSFPLDGRGLGKSVILREERLPGFISCSLPEFSAQVGTRAPC